MGLFCPLFEVLQPIKWNMFQIMAPSLVYDKVAESVRPEKEMDRFVL